MAWGIQPSVQRITTHFFLVMDKLIVYIDFENLMGLTGYNGAGPVSGYVSIHSTLRKTATQFHPWPYFGSNPGAIPAFYIHEERTYFGS